MKPGQHRGRPPLRRAPTRGGRAIAIFSAAVVVLSIIGIGVSGQLGTLIGSRASAGVRTVQSDAQLSGMSNEVTLLSQGMPAYASSTQGPRVYPASAAVDGDPGTRW